MRIREQSHPCQVDVSPSIVREHERFLHNVPLLAQTEVDRNPAVLSKLPKRPCRHLDDKSRVVSGVPISPVGSIEAPWGRFGYSDLKEAGGVCGGCGQAIGIESTLACNMLKEVG